MLTEYSADEVGKILNITGRAVRKAIARGKIKGVRTVRKGWSYWTIPAEEVERYKAIKHPQRPAAGTTQTPWLAVA
jgi:excisionase family DNA binding protein